jgi:hypothetical protein
VYLDAGGDDGGSDEITGLLLELGHLIVRHGVTFPQPLGAWLDQRACFPRRRNLF